jgi:hypothetical protein
MKKTLLASCVALVSATSQAELSPMSEFELHKVTGQAGVDIELDVGIEIGEIRYTDTVTNGDGDGGSLVIDTISIGGGEGRNTLFGNSDPGNTANLDGLKFAIDALADGTLQIVGRPIRSNGIGIVDIEVTTGFVETRAIDDSRGVRLVDSISMYGGALGLSMIVDGATNDIGFRALIGLEDIDVDMSTNGIFIKDAYIYGSGYNREDALAQPSDLAADIYVSLSKEDGGVRLDFSPQAGRDRQNIFDMGVRELTVGDGVIGSIDIDDLSIQGVALNISGHE